jgi:hypothetical protein
MDRDTKSDQPVPRFAAPRVSTPGEAGSAMNRE